MCTLELLSHQNPNISGTILKNEPSTPNNITYPTTFTSKIQTSRDIAMVHLLQGKYQGLISLSIKKNVFSEKVFLLRLFFEPSHFLDIPSISRMVCAPRRYANIIISQRSPFGGFYPFAVWPKKLSDVCM